MPIGGKPRHQQRGFSELGAGILILALPLLVCSTLWKQSQGLLHWFWKQLVGMKFSKGYENPREGCHESAPVIYYLQVGDTRV